MQADVFLNNHPEFVLCEVCGETSKHTAPGFLFPGCVHPEIVRCRRFYPHISRGEGQFFALFRRTSGGGGTINYKSVAEPVKKPDLEVVRSFFKDTLGKCDFEFALHDGCVCILPDFPVPPYAVFSAGVWFYQSYPCR